MTDTSSTWQFWPSRLDNIERIENYRKGGFHPVSIGDSFSNGRYRFSTVWLARDEKSDRLECATDHPACDHVLSLLDHFKFEGPNGCHTCLVSPIAGPDLSQISIYHNPDRSTSRRRLRGALARKFAKQVTLAVGYLHSRGVGHGDISNSNVLIQLAHVDSWSDRDLYELLGSPVTDKVRLSSGELNNMASAPEYLVEPANLANLESKWFTDKIVLVDCSHSFMLQSPPQEDIAMTMSYCAPEVYFDGNASAWSDIWALGCTIFEIRAGRQLFESFLGGSFEVIRQIVRTLGKLPEPWWSSWDKRHQNSRIVVFLQSIR
ncbi:kinase-like domain-containing protein [Lipomyces starkeyi]